MLFRSGEDEDGVSGEEDNVGGSSDEDLELTIAGGKLLKSTCAQPNSNTKSPAMASAAPTPSNKKKHQPPTTATSAPPPPPLPPTSPLPPPPNADNAQNDSQRSPLDGNSGMNRAAALLYPVALGSGYWPCFTEIDSKDAVSRMIAIVLRSSSVFRATSYCASMEVSRTLVDTNFNRFKSCQQSAYKVIILLHL